MASCPKMAFTSLCVLIVRIINHIKDQS
jgi:hypothetical protein